MESLKKNSAFKYVSCKKRRINRVFNTGFFQFWLSLKRGGKDCCLDATLSLDDFTRIMLAPILQRNQYAVLAKYDRDADMSSDMALTPLNIWYSIFLCQILPELARN